jgi:RES domain-containing protein
MSFIRPPDGLAAASRRVDVRAFWQGTSRTFDADALVTAEKGNRWNAPGEPTAYLAGDPGVALIERGRHLATEGPVELLVWRLRVVLDGVLDLRSDDTRHALGLVEPCWVLDRERCRQLGSALRGTNWCRGMLVPSAGIPDAIDRWNLVVFVERLSRPLANSITDVQSWGVVSLGEVDRSS